jgi:hypothetical protein
MHPAAILPPRLALQLIAALWFALAASAYLVDSLSAILHWAPHALYADQWRQYLDYVTLPFPQNVLHPDNGHWLVVPNLVAWIELVWFAGNQWLQILVGLLAMSGAVATVAWVCLRDRGVPMQHRAAGAFLGTFAIFWLGNIRTLFHSTELLHTSLPIACLMLAGSACIAATRSGPARSGGLGYVAAATALAFVATFSFGYGIAVFIAIVAVLVARRANRSQLFLALGGLIATAALYVLMPGGDGVRGVLVFAPAENLLIGARWLGAPFVTLFGYLWNPDLSGLITIDALSARAHQLAVLMSQRFPDLRTGVLPYAALGAGGMIALTWISFRRLRATAPAGATEALGLGIAWLGVTAAGIVSVSRLSAFQKYPDQIYADRYLPWPCLFWLGLALIALGRAPRSLAARGTLMFAFLLPLFGWPIQTGGQIYAALVRGLIDNTADGSIVGVIERGVSLGETQTDEFVRGLPELRRRRVAQFATRAAGSIGTTASGSHALPDAVITTRPIADNLIGSASTAVVLRLPAPGAAAHEPLLLIDGDGIVVGLASSDARLDPPGYSGYANCSPCSGGLRAAALDQ